MSYIVNGGNAFADADALWYNFQDKLFEFVNEEQGSSAIIPATTDNRLDWDEVKEVLQGQKPISELGCN